MKSQIKVHETEGVPSEFFIDNMIYHIIASNINLTSIKSSFYSILAYIERMKL